MAFTVTPLTSYGWQNSPSTATPLDQTHLQAAEQNTATWATAQIAALDSYLEGILAPLASPVLTGTPTAPTAAGGTNTTQLATTAFVQALVAGVSGLSSSTTGAGAELGTYGRTSTIGTPTLAVVASLNDWASSVNGNSTTDDSTILTTAKTAVNAAGGGTLILPPLNANGTQATWTFQAVSIESTANVTISAYGAQLQIVSATSGAAMFKGTGSSTSPGTYIISSFRLLGGTFLGRGTEMIGQSVVRLDRSTDCTIRDTFVQNWGSSGGSEVFGIVGSRRFRITNNTCINCSGPANSGAQNVINIQIGSTFLENTVPLEDGIVEGNIVHGTPAAAVALSFGNTANVQQLRYAVYGNPTAGTGTTSFIRSGVTYTTTAIGPNATAAQVQTAFQNGITSGGGPASAVVCYGGPVGGVAPVTPVFIVFQSNFSGQITGLTVADSWTGGTNAQSSLEYPPLRIAIRNNDLESVAWAAVVMELGGSPAALGPMLDVSITANILRYTGPVQTGCFGVWVYDQTSTDYAQFYRYILIAENLIHSNSVGIGVQGSDITLGHNEITAYVSGILIQNPDGTSGVNYISHVTVKGGAIHMVDSGISGGAGISLFGVQDSLIDTDIYWDTGTTADIEAIQVINGQRLDIACRITNAPLRGIRLSGNIGEIRVASGTRILNPSSETAVTTSGIRVDGTLTDNIWIEGGVSIRDARGGGAQMSYAVDTSAATLGSFGVYLQGSQRFVGWTSGALNGTFASKGDGSIWDTTGVRFTQGKRVAYGTAIPTTGTWGQGDLFRNQAPVAAGPADFWCVSGGTPGIWSWTSLAQSNGTKVVTGASYQMVAADLMVIAGTNAMTITLPTALTAQHADKSYVVKLGLATSCTVSTGSTGKIDDSTIVTGGVNATTDPISTAAQANVYIPYQPGTANYGWTRS